MRPVRSNRAAAALRLTLRVLIDPNFCSPCSLAFRAVALVDASDAAADALAASALAAGDTGMRALRPAHSEHVGRRAPQSNVKRLLCAAEGRARARTTGEGADDAVAACLTAGDDDGVRATCDERAASGDGRDAATSGGDAGDDAGDDDDGAEPPKKKKKGKTAAGRCGSGEWESLTRTRCESREASASGVRRTMSSVARGGDFGMGYSQSNATLDLCVDVLVRPTRILPRQSGAAGPCSTLRGCTARPGSSVTYCSPAAPTGPSP